MELKLKHLSAILALIMTTSASANTETKIASEPIQTLKQSLYDKGTYNLSGKEGFTIKRRWTDELGKTHTHFDQTINGIKVYGTSMITHANPPTNSVMRLDAASNFYAVTGKLATVESSVAKQSVKSLRANSYNSKHIAAYAATLGEVVSKPQLAYVYLPTHDETKLAYKTEIKYDSVSGFEHDILFFDAATGAELTRHPQVHRAKAHYTYDMRNRLFSDSFAPGILMCLTKDVCRDESSQRAHSGASVVYDYYYNVHGRESIINSLTPVVSTVHTGVNWNNAA